MVRNESGEPLISKNLALTLIGALIVQSLGAIWWAATISRDVTTIARDVAQLRQEAYSRAEAVIQMQRLDQRSAAINDRVSEMDTRVRQFENNARSERSERFPRAQ